MQESSPRVMPDAVRSREVVTTDANIGRYRIVRRLEINATSELVLATTEGALGFERAVVIKRLLPHAHADSKHVESFVSEASAYARLTHPAIVRLYDFLTVDEMPAMVLEHVEGVSLQALLAALRARGEQLPVAAALYIGTQIFAALGAAHAARDLVTRAPSPVIHRDVSPGNVLIATNAEVKLSNFAFAKLLGSSATDMNLEIPKGTVGYMAPEQLLGDPVTPRTDVYAGALLVRELLTGEPAFISGDEAYVDYLQAMAKPSLAPIVASCPQLPGVVGDALQIALDPASARRRLSAAAMQRVLGAHREGGRAQLREVLLRLELVRGGDDDAALPDDSSPTVPSLLRLRSRVRHARAAAAFATCALLFGAIALRSGAHSARGSPAPPPVASPAHAEEPSVLAPPTRPAEPPPAEPAPVVVMPPPVDGELRIPGSTPSHRVFIDGRLAGVSGAMLTLPCGTHSVRIGGGGKTRSVAVPCGGTTILASR